MDLHTYTIHLSYSRNGTNWSQTTISVKATDDMGAIAQAESKYPYVKNIEIKSVR